MSLTATVTPGYIFTTGETVTEEKLNQLGGPTVVITGDSAATVQPNLFSNPDLSIWQRGAGPVSCPEDDRTFLADHWFVRPRLVTPGSDTWVAYYQKETDVINNDGLYRARFGFTSRSGSAAGEMEFGQERLARVTCKLANTFLVQCEIENQTGVSFRPKARIYTCTTADTFGTTTAQETVDGNAATGSNTLGNGERRLFYFTFTATAYDAALKLGGEVCIVIPDPASAAGYVRIYGQLKLETGSTPTTREPERDASGERTTSAGTSTGAGTAFEYLLNGDFAHMHFANEGNPLSVSTTETQIAKGWLAKTAAGTAVFEQGISSLPNTATGTAIKCTGAVGVDALLVTQRIYAAAAHTAARSLVFSAYIRNGTGASLTPTLKINTCNALESFGAVTNRISQALTPIADGDWVRVSYVIDGTAVTNIGYGFEVQLSFAAGTMNANTKTIRIAQASLLPGLALADWTASPEKDGPAPLATWRNLKIVRDFANPTDATITADEVVLVTADGRARTYQSVTCLVDISAAGAGGLDTGSVANNTEYYLWLVAKDNSIAGVFSTSGTVPSSLESYPFRARISNFKTWPNTHADFGGAAVIPFQFQLDRTQAYYIEGSDTYLAAAYVPAGTTLTAVAITGLPSTAVAIGGHAGVTTGGADPCCLDVAGESHGYGFQRIVIPNAQLWNDNQAGGSFKIPIAQTANLYLAGQNSAAQEYTVCINQIDIA